ncbi:MAG: archease [Candidatus Micrarchaeia archaeon]
MQNYRFLDHTADVEFEASGTTIASAFRNSLYALFDTQVDTKMLKKTRSKTYKITVKEKSRDIDTLLWDFLQDSLSKCEARDLFGYSAKKLKIQKAGSAYLLHAEILAKRKCSECARLEVKGISKYGLKVVRRGGKFIAQVVVDV